MPAIRHYRVTQTRVVNVSANTPADAVQIAESAFTGGQRPDNDVIVKLEGIWGHPTSRVRSTGMTCGEEH